MQPLKITARLASAIGVYDDYSPSLDALIEWLLLDREGLTTPNPTPDQVEATRSFVDANMPLDKGDIGGEWYWKVSSPFYTILSEQSDRFRKKWDYQEHNLNWGRRKAKWNTSEGAEKNYDLPLYLRSTPQIAWYAVGDISSVCSIINNCTGIGKKRSFGNGQVSRWTAEVCDEDWHLWGPNGQLMRPMPKRILDRDIPSALLLNWGWRPPAWLYSNKELCHMPVGNVCRSRMAVG